MKSINYKKRHRNLLTLILIFFSSSLSLPTTLPLATIFALEVLLKLISPFCVLQGSTFLCLTGEFVVVVVTGVFSAGSSSSLSSNYNKKKT